MEETTEHIGGIEVTFPFKPYGLQKAYMSKVVSCVSESKNGLLESPTGTGKTLSLLCSSLAWLKIKRADEAKSKKQSGEPEFDIEDLFQEENEKKYKKKKEAFVPKDWKQRGTRIVYSSRTHMQLSQAVGEMKKTNYKSMNGVVLGSRDQYCLNSDVTRLDNIAAKNHACRVKNNHNSCPYYSQLDSKLFATADYTETPVHDIEDLVSLGKRHTVCPYYASKALAQRADIVFVPYNYLIDKQARKSQELGLKDSVVIIDEGHNIERSLEETASTELSSQSLASCKKYLETLYKELSGEANCDEAVDETVKKSLQHLEPKEVDDLKDILFDFERELDKFIVSIDEEKVFFPDAMIYRLLDKACFDWILLKVIDNIITYLVAKSAFLPNVTVVISALHRLEHFLKTLYPDNVVNGDVELDTYQKTFSKNFKVFAVKSVNKYVPKKDNWFSRKKASEPETSWILNVLCLTPSIAMHSLLNCGVRSCIITSGTLAPLKTFEAELDVPFPVILQNKHIIKSTNLKVLAIGSGKYGSGKQKETFNSAYTNRENDKYYYALGDAIAEYARLIPHGVFLFFSSYTLMDKCTNKWKDMCGGTIWSKITTSKHVFTESKNKTTFDEDFKRFKAKVDEHGSKGALFLGVCRGKLSEGLDAGDQYCRAVIVAGLPFPAQNEPRVHLKRKYLDDNKTSNSMSSTTWYQLQMTRAINQAIGRIIRHKDDYGVVILLDSRFSQWKDDLSSWIRDFFTEKSLDESFVVVENFFTSKIAKKSIEAPEPEKFGLQPGLRRKHDVIEPSSSTFINQYTEGSPRKKEYVEEPRSVFDALSRATNQNVHNQFKPPSSRSNFPAFVCNISPIKSNMEPKKRKLNVPLVTLQPMVVEERLQKKDVEKGIPENSLMKYSVELKQMFAGTNKFNRLCQTFKNYTNHKKVQCFMSEIKWIFDGVDTEKRTRSLKELSKAIKNEEDRDKFLKGLDVDVKSD